jgi:hypothetical protein
MIIFFFSGVSMGTTTLGVFSCFGKWTGDKNILSNVRIQDLGGASYIFQVLKSGLAYE